MPNLEIVRESPSGSREWLMQQLEPPGTLMKLVRYLLIFWSACLVAALGTGYGLIHSGMSAQNAYYSGLTVALLPVVAIAIMAAIYWWLTIFRN